MTEETASDSNEKFVSESEATTGDGTRYRTLVVDKSGEMSDD